MRDTNILYKLIASSLELIPDEDCKTSDQFWDCECTYNYIHHNSEQLCMICTCAREDQPPSRLREVLLMLLKDLL